MKLRLSNLKSWGVLVFTFLVVLRAVLWLSMEWPSNNDPLLNPSDRVVKIHNLPVHFMVYWPDSNRYWPSSQKTFGESLSFILHDQNRWGHLQYLFFLPVRVLTDNFAYGVLAQNILGLISAWILFVMMRPQGTAFAAIVVFISFANLFTISMEYALLREVLTRFLVLSSLYLLWRMAISPGWRLAIAAGGALFLLPWSRPELLIIAVLIIPVVLWRFSLNYATVIILISLLEICAYVKIAGYGHSRYHLLQNLVTESYNYDSPDLRDLPKRIYTRAMQCKSLYGVDPQWPSFRYQWFEPMKDEVVEEWKKENGILGGIKKEGYFDILFLDVLKNNTKYVAYSVVYSFWSYFTCNLITISPLIYAGDNPNYTFGWPYYSSPDLTWFGDPLSELVPEARGPKWLTTIMTPFSEYWLRRICAPFFFIGLFCTGRMFLQRRETVPTSSIVFWLLAVSWTVTLLLIACFIGLRTSRFIFSVDPIMFAVSILGMQAVGRTLLECWSVGVYPLIKSMIADTITEMQAVGRMLREYWRPLIKLLIRFTIVGTIIVAIGIRFILKNDRHLGITPLLSNAYAVWNMDPEGWHRYLLNLLNSDEVSGTIGKIADLRGKYGAMSFRAEIAEGHFGKARYFNGKDSYIQTPVNFQGWKVVTISLWVKPEHKDGDELSVILDNGHDAKNNFAIQSADSSGEKWVWHCSGIDIFFDLPLNKWTHLVVVADGENGIVRVYTNGLKVTEVRSDNKFEFGHTPLTIGKLSKINERYFKGSIDEVIVWDKVIEK